MSFDSIDYRRIRGHTERRLSPMLKLHRRRTRLIVYTAIFGLFLLLNGLLRHLMDIGYTTITLETLRDWYAAFMLGSLLWLSLLSIQVIGLALAFRHEEFIQREISREIDLEGLRVLRERSQVEQFSEKPKHRVALNDDGELIPNDELPDKPLRQNMNQRE